MDSKRPGIREWRRRFRVERKRKEKRFFMRVSAFSAGPSVHFVESVGCAFFRRHLCGVDSAHHCRDSRA